MILVLTISLFSVRPTRKNRMFCEKVRVSIPGLTPPEICYGTDFKSPRFVVQLILFRRESKRFTVQDQAFK